MATENTVVDPSLVWMTMSPHGRFVLFHGYVALSCCHHARGIPQAGGPLVEANRGVGGGLAWPRRPHRDSGQIVLSLHIGRGTLEQTCSTSFHPLVSIQNWPANRKEVVAP